MIHDSNDVEPERHANRIFQELERYIRKANTKAISKATGGITLDSLYKAARYVSQLRACYLKEMLRLAECEDATHVGTCTVPKVKNLRVAYEEALLGFDALRHALDRGYFSIEIDEQSDRRAAS